MTLLSMDDRDLLRARWATFAALSLVFGFYLVTELPLNHWVAALIAVATASLLTAVLEFWLRLSLRRALAGQNLVETRQRYEYSRVHLRAAIELQRQFLQAHSENEVLEVILVACAESLRASGASFVPYDEWGQSLPPLVHGKTPENTLQAWTQRLSSPETRQACKHCETMHGGPDCALLVQTRNFPSRLKCFPLFRGEQEVGVANFFFDHDVEIDADSQAFVSDILRSAGFALEMLQSRDQEIAALRYLQTAAPQKSDLSDLLKNLLENVQHALDVDFAILYLPSGELGNSRSEPLLLTRERAEIAAAFPLPNLSFLEGLWKSVLSTGHSISLENVTLNKNETWKVLLAVPLAGRAGEPSGVLVLGSNSAQPFAQRQQMLLETLAAQSALLIQNARLMVQLEYQAVVDERTRLAREIHDGLAQTLAFLKIQAMQMQSYLSRGEIDRLTDSLQASYRTLSDAYVDARQAIDNLRRIPSTGLRSWIEQAADDFTQTADIMVDLSEFSLSVDYSVNIQAQLIRIVQEALNNVRKHALAKHVSIRGWQDGDFSVIQIRDDGVGFVPAQVESSARYGLKGMYERAESIGADFQITSRPGRGTTISLRIPVSIWEKV